jgi:hypothetical protein
MQIAKRRIIFEWNRSAVRAKDWSYVWGGSGALRRPCGPIAARQVTGPP